MEASIEQKKAEYKKAKQREAGLAIAMIAPFFLIFIFFHVVPFVMGVAFSFMKYDPYNLGETQFIGFKNFADLLNFKNSITLAFWKSFLPMLLFNAVTIPLCIILPLFFAYHVNRRPPGYKIFRFLLYLPSIVSITITGAVFGSMFKGDSSGIVNAIFGTDINWLAGEPWNNDFPRWFVMFLVRMWCSVGGNFVIFSGALRNVPKSLYEACEMDGGTNFTKFFKVTFPHIKGSINVCLFNTFIGQMAMYELPYVFSALSNKDIAVAPMMWIQKYLLGGMAYSTRTGYLCAAALMFGAVVGMLTFIEQKVTNPSRKRTKNTALYEELKNRRTALSSEIVAKEERANE